MNYTANFTEVFGSNETLHIVCDSENQRLVHHFSSTFTILIVAWLVLIILFDLIGNSLVILVILRNPSMRDMHQLTNLFLLNLAVADLLVAVLVIPFSIHTVILECWDLSMFFCKLNSFLLTLSFITSIHTLMYISIHKYISVKRVVQDMFNSPVTKKTCFIMLAATWIYGLVFAIATYISGPIYKEKTMQCGPKYPRFGQMSGYIHIANQIGNILIPLVIMIFCYLRIFFYIQQHARINRRMSITHENNPQRERGLTITLFIVLACFLGCWTPYWVYTNYAAYLDDRRKIPYFLNPLAYCFGYMNSACNPIIYAWRLPTFRKGYRDILTRTRYIVTVADGGRRVCRPLSNDDLTRRTSRPSVTDHDIYRISRPSLSTIDRQISKNSASSQERQCLSMNGHGDKLDTVFSDQDSPFIEDKNTECKTLAVPDKAGDEQVTEIIALKEKNS